MRELYLDPLLEGIGMRHDVDYSLEKALVIARAEAEQGCRSTFYLLHTADYWGDDNFDEWCRELELLGHEVALHVNFVAQWYRGEIEELDTAIEAATRRLRATGVSVSGWAAHGDPDCYRGQFTNYWHDADLEPANPIESETGISAEGIPDCIPQFQLTYPLSGKIKNILGQELTLWSVSMGKYAYNYHAIHVSHDRYFSDSGGSWRRTSNPYDTKYDGGRWQILVHPEYWIEKPRVFLYTGGISLRTNPGRWKLIDFRGHGQAGDVADPAAGGFEALKPLVSCADDTMIYNLPEGMVPKSVGGGSRWGAGVSRFPELGELEPQGEKGRLYLERVGWRVSTRVDRHFYSVDRSDPVEVKSNHVNISHPKEGLIEVCIPLRRFRMWSVLRPWLDEVQLEYSIQYEAASSSAGLYLALGMARRGGGLARGWLGFLLGIARIGCARRMVRVSSLPEGRRRITFRMTRPRGVMEISPVIRVRGSRLEIRILEVSVVRKYGGIPTEGIQGVSIENLHTEPCKKM